MWYIQKKYNIKFSCIYKHLHSSPIFTRTYQQYTLFIKILSEGRLHFRAMSLYSDLLDTTVSRKRGRGPRKPRVLYSKTVFGFGFLQTGPQWRSGYRWFHRGAVGTQCGGVGSHGCHAAVGSRRVRFATSVCHWNTTLWKKEIYCRTVALS